MKWNKIHEQYFLKITIYQSHSAKWFGRVWDPEGLAVQKHNKALLLSDLMHVTAIEICRSQKSNKQVLPIIVEREYNIVQLKRMQIYLLEK